MWTADRLFSKIAMTYNRSDVFNVDDLVAIVGLHAHVETDVGQTVKQWRQQLGQKFTKLPGICSLHNFVTHLISNHACTATLLYQSF